MALLALNCGSSSLKFKLFKASDLSVLSSGSASSVGTDNASLKISGKETKKGLKDETHHSIFEMILKELGKEHDIQTVTHRIVHGGPQTEPMVVTKEHQDGLKAMDDLTAFAPLHNHHAVLVVRSSLELLPKAKNVLCFDTLFHSSLAPEVYTYPVPHNEVKSPVPLRKYGFHGLSYAYILKRTAAYLKKSVDQTSLIVCHLGSGASMCCIKNGKSIDTTMGLTPLEGLPGGTRSGTIDPSLIFHMSDALHPQDIVKSSDVKASKGELLMNKESGFKAMCGTSDFGEISKRADAGDKDAKLCVDLFTNRVLHFLGAYLLLLRNAPDAIVFSGGIGEKSSSLRQDVCAAIDYLSVQLDEKLNMQDSEDEVLQVSSSQSKIKVLRVLTDEEVQCAEMAKAL